MHKLHALYTQHAPQVPHTPHASPDAWRASTYSYASERESLTSNTMIWTPLSMKNKKNTNINILSCIIYQINSQEEPSLFNNEAMSLYK